MSEFQTDKLSIPAFQAGINQSTDEAIIKLYESPNALNCDLSEGTLRTAKYNKKYVDSFSDMTDSIGTFYPTKGDPKHFATLHGELVSFIEGQNASQWTTESDLISGNVKYINFFVNDSSEDNKALIVVGGEYTPVYYNGTTTQKLKNRRKNRIWGLVNVLKNADFKIKAADYNSSAMGATYEQVMSAGNVTYDTKRFTLKTSAELIETKGSKTVTLTVPYGYEIALQQYDVDKKKCMAKDTGYKKQGRHSVELDEKTKYINVYGRKPDNAVITTTQLASIAMTLYLEPGLQDGWVDANGNIVETEAEITTYAPKAKYATMHYNRLWLAGDPENPDRLYFSTADREGYDVQDFTAPVDEAEANMHGGFVDVSTYDGSRIVGLTKAFDDLLVFKNYSIHKIVGNNPSNYQMVDVFSAEGGIADKSIANIMNSVYFLNRDGIYVYDGTNVRVISDKIRNVINRINQNFIDKSCATSFENKYYLALPIDDSTTNNCIIEYNTITGAFMVFNTDNHITAFAEFNGKLLFSGQGGVYEFSKFNADGVQAMPLYWETPWIDFRQKNAKKASEYIYFTASGTGNIKFTLMSERTTKQREVPLTDTPIIYRKKLKNKGRQFKLIIENVDNSEFELKGLELTYESDID